MKIYAIFATLTAFVFLVLYLWTIPIRCGGGQGESSPSGEFVANASSLRDAKLFGIGESGVYYEFEVYRDHTTPFKKLVLYPSEKNSEGYFRSLPKIIRWAEDSSEVTFTIPGATLKIDMKDHPEERN